MDGGPGWQDVADRLRADHPPATALVEAYAREMARARDFVAQRGLAPIPDAPLDVVPTPAFMRPIIPFAAYDSPGPYSRRSEEHTSELQSHSDLVCRLLLEKKKKQ